ncbi:lipoate--protein ligase A [Citrifermentans bemidjiense Bem]|uniref:Lipoate--protein ligase A n=1 Tax=Citrifermentans bemidjiense (strain ATCC BAA-1014 / DSM 16622 / JCM 12645 / Bem) TaxID=404380 RepID=B5EAW9_CITBB|nr:lipoate--protein ligase family protein [Citrifermentans bemidjiense]ACH37428.1 lipoate--protein ligase A [Citrifermentans bemidjiense Bem]
MFTWRLIDTGPLEGPANMALDEALLNCFDKDRSQPLLRLYGWDPPALSVGRFQDAAAALKLDLCREEEVPVVRRMTGGGIIYHAQELTYSIVCAPGHIGGAAGVKDGFRRLCAFLMGTYQKLGLEASFAADLNPDGERLGARTTFCFAGKEEFDIVVRGRKIGGNAQRRVNGAILQHGSIPLVSRVQHGLRYLKEPAPGAAGAVSLAELGIAVEASQLKRTLVESFQERLGVSLRPHPPTEAELGAAALLETRKYRNANWNLEGRT